MKALKCKMLSSEFATELFVELTNEQIADLRAFGNGRRIH